MENIPRQVKDAKHLERCWSSLGFLTVSAQASHLRGYQKTIVRMAEELTGRTPWLVVNIVECRCYRGNTKKKVSTDNIRQQKEQNILEKPALQ